MKRMTLASLCLALALSVHFSETPHLIGQDSQTADPARTSATYQIPDGELLDKMRSVVRQYVETEKAVGGELLIMVGGQPVFHESFGMSDREDEQQWENNTLCNIRSMTKPITSAAAQILVDRNQLDLDATVADYLESFDNEESRDITVRQVLTHRSGLPLSNLTTPYQFESLSDQVADAGKRGPKFDPDSKFWYSDTGTDVVAALVEKISGEPLHEFVGREIFEPLGMSNTLYGIDESDKRLSQAASLYVKVPKGWMRFWKAGGKPLYPFAWGSQTVYSTTSDYARFLQMLANRGRVGERQLLSPEAVDRMLDPVSRMKMLGSDTDYPTGFRDVEAHYGQMMVTHRVIGKKELPPVVIGHSGSDGTNAWAFPDRDLVILYFTQSRGGLTALNIEDPLDELIVHRGKSVPVPEKLRPYLGTFIAHNDRSFRSEAVTVKSRNGVLILDVPSEMAFKLLEPDEQGRWAFAIAPNKVHVIFDKNKNDEIVGLKINQGKTILEAPREGTDRAKELAAKRDAAQHEKSSGKLKEAWVGRLDMGARKPVMQFRIVTKGSGKDTAFFDSITEGKTGFEANWSIEGDQLKFDVPEIKLTFRGTLNEDRDSAEGTWSQGGRELPLTLNKQDKEYER